MKTEINKLAPEILLLISTLQHRTAAQLLLGIYGGVSADIAALVAQLRAEENNEIWRLFLKLYDRKNKLLLEELERFVERASDDDLDDDDASEIARLKIEIEKEKEKALVEDKVARLVAQLPLGDAALLLSVWGGGECSPELAGLIARLQEELNWAPLLKYFNERNKFLNEQLELACQHADGMRM
jgi:hypothetical protein